MSDARNTNLTADVAPKHNRNSNLKYVGLGSLFKERNPYLSVPVANVSRPAVQPVKESNTNRALQFAARNLHNFKPSSRNPAYGEVDALDALTENKLIVTKTAPEPKPKM